MKIDIYLFNAYYKFDAVIDCPEIRRTPQQLIEFLRGIIEGWNKESHATLSIRTYSDIPINFIGSLVAQKKIAAEDIRIFQSGLNPSCWYDEEGIVSEGWDYGNFHWYE